MTKERVRQIQNKALSKIKRLMEDGVLRTKTQVIEEPAVPVAATAEAAV